MEKLQKRGLNVELKVIWSNEEQFGCEYLKLVSKNGNLTTAQGTIIFIDGEKSDAHNINYTVELDEHWITKRLNIVVDYFSSLELISDGEGNWFNTDGEPVDKLKGAIDIDISATPFSNSLPINRVNWEENQLEHFEMVYILVPSLELKKVLQSYRFIRSENGLKYFHYRCYDYETIICVDANGLVVNYPGVFMRKI